MKNLIFLISAVTFCSVGFAKPYKGPLLEKVVGGLVSDNGVVKRCEIYAHDGHLSAAETIALIQEAKQGKVEKLFVHSRAQVPTIEYFAYLPTRKYGLATVEQVLLLRDYSAGEGIKGPAAEKLLQTIQDYCKE